MTYQLRRRHLLIALLISLFFHLCMFIHFAGNYSLNFFPSLQKKEELPQQITQKNNPQDKEWVETKTRSEQYGADVIFSDMPDDEITPYHAEHSEDEAQKNTTATPSPQPEASENESPTQNTQQQIINETIDTQQAPTALKIITSTITPPVIPSQQQKRAVQSSFLQKKPQNSQSKPLIMPKKMPTLAQITRGVLNYAQEGGSHSVSMLGKKNGIPSDKQLQYERYLQKINLCINNSFHINKYNTPDFHQSAYASTLFISFNRDGSLRYVRLQESCGDPRWDAFWIHILRDADGSFPSVPRYLPHDPLDVSYVLKINR